MSATIDIDSREFEIGNMPPREQFHVMRRLGPALKSMAVLQMIAPKPGEEPNPEFMVRVVGELMDAVGAMTDEDADYVLNSCLRRVRLKEANGWAPIWSNGSMMYDFITMPLMLRLTIEVIRENLSGFSLGQFASSPVAQ